MTRCECNNSIIKSGGVTTLPQNCHLYTPQKRRDFTSAAVCFQAENMAVSEGLFFSSSSFFFKIYLSRIVGRVHIQLLFYFLGCTQHYIHSHTQPHLRAANSIIVFRVTSLNYRGLHFSRRPCY